MLAALKIPFTVNPSVVRGLDYYTRTVFEFVSKDIGAQGTVCGGGRYDGLVEMLGGTPTPAVGWAMGVERLFELIEKVEPKKLDYFIVSKFPKEALKLCQKLRQKNLSCDFDMQNRKFAKQLEKAAKVANYAIILGEEEIEKGFYTVKDLSNGTQTQRSEI